VSEPGHACPVCAQPSATWTTSDAGILISCARCDLREADGAEVERRMAARAAEPDSGLHLIRACDVEAAPVRWAWADRLPLGALSLVVGDPGLGKTTVAAELAARFTRGQATGDLHGWPVDVVIATAEDALSVLRLRLEAAGADLERVHFAAVRRDGLDTGLTLPDDVPELERRAREVGARAVIIDPVAGHLSGAVDSHRDASLRRALAPLAKMAEATDATITGIAHLNKAEAADLLRRVGGSVALTAAARSILLLTRDPSADDENDARRVLMHGKSNYGPTAAPLLLRIEGREVSTAEGPAPVSGVAWLGEAAGVTLSDVLATGASGDERAERDGAVEWLRDYLAGRGGVAPAADVHREAARDGIAKTTLHRVRRRAGVATEKGGFGAGWQWRLEDSTKIPRSSEAGIVESSAPSKIPSAPEDSEDSTPERVKPSVESSAAEVEL
jgi:hypothetical protein